MRNALIIAQRQFRSYFNGPIAYIVICLIMLVLGFMFWNPFFLQQRASVRLMFTYLGAILVFGVPALTMGLLAEEKRTGTIELLITMPVRDSEVIMGKYLGVLGLFMVLLVLTLPYPISVSTLGHLDWGEVAGGYLGMFLTGATLIAVGVMTSSWTDSQLIAFFAALLIGFFMWMMNRFLVMFGSGSIPILSWFALATHTDDMGAGVIDTRDLLFFFSVTIFALMVAFRSLESRRWR